LPDVHDTQTRSRNMAAIRGKNTKPELLLRSALHRAGYRFRLNTRLPGKPDLTLHRYRATIFVHGCFWHRHDCPRFRQPAGNAEFWHQKLARNAERDHEVSRLLREAGWRQMVVWECALTGKGRLDMKEITRKIGNWLSAEDYTGEIAGRFK